MIAVQGVCNSLYPNASPFHGTGCMGCCYLKWGMCTLSNRCLEDQIDHNDMSKECKDEVMKDMNRMAQDFRLNWRLNHACEADIGKLCPNACSNMPGVTCGGLVLQCLQDKQDNITSQACQDEVFYYELMEVSDFRNDVILAEACRNDVESYCKDVEPGKLRESRAPIITEYTPICTLI